MTAYEEGRENGHTAGHAAGLEAAETANTMESYTFQSETEEGMLTCSKRTVVYMDDDPYLSHTTSHPEPNNDACCIAGIAAGK